MGDAEAYRVFLCTLSKDYRSSHATLPSPRSCQPSTRAVELVDSLLERGPGGAGGHQLPLQQGELRVAVVHGAREAKEMRAAAGRSKGQSENRALQSLLQELAAPVGGISMRSEIDSRWLQRLR